MIRLSMHTLLAMTLVIWTSSAYSYEKQSSSKPKKTKKRVSKVKKSAANSNAYVTYDSYLQSNYSHPAISRKPSSVNQIAFPEPTRRAVIEEKEAELAPDKSVIGAPQGGTPQGGASQSGVSQGGTSQGEPAPQVVDPTTSPIQPYQ